MQTLRLFFPIFSKATFWTYVVYDLDKSTVYYFSSWSQVDNHHGTRPDKRHNATRNCSVLDWYERHWDI